ncbi:MAG: hypothetical protein IPG62_14285 [Sphingomonadales bacterium]|nr:hypothetical protein [Sphingomonadales bacterium]
MALTIDPRPFVSVRHDQFEVEAKGLGAYLIDVSIPANLARDSRLPVILVLDGNLIFDLVQAIAHGRFTEAAGPLPPAIIVGVGYPAREGFSTYYARRNFDFHGPWEMTDPLGLQLKGLFTSLRNAEGSSGHATEILAGGYSKFLSFLRDDLLPGLAAHYPIDLDGNHTLIGDSSGGILPFEPCLTPNRHFQNILPSVPALAPHQVKSKQQKLHLPRPILTSGRRFSSVQDLLKWMKVCQLPFVVLAARRSGPPSSSRSGTGQMHG